MVAHKTSILYHIEKKLQQFNIYAFTESALEEKNGNKLTVKITEFFSSMQYTLKFTIVLFRFNEVKVVH